MDVAEHREVHAAGHDKHAQVTVWRQHGIAHEAAQATALAQQQRRAVARQRHPPAQSHAVGVRHFGAHDGLQPVIRQPHHMVQRERLLRLLGAVQMPTHPARHVRGCGIDARAGVHHVGHRGVRVRLAERIQARHQPLLLRVVQHIGGIGQARRLDDLVGQHRRIVRSPRLRQRIAQLA
ncbi:hypothetical protein G6F68_015408 [Rhizopus microsporus]|nr:hypothetical protein G6F68_015408 [Rhizopus microsporus]